MKKSILISFLFCASAFGAEPIAQAYRDRVVESIWRVEGGAKTKHPYGILSVKTSNPKRVCENTVSNNFIRYQNAKNKSDYHCFLDYLADKYCPPSADKQGNINWKKNIHTLVK